MSVPPRRAARTIWTPTAVSLLVVMAVLALLMTWAMVTIIGHGVAGSPPSANYVAGSLVFPPPRVAGGLPRRPSAVGEPGAGPIVTAAGHRFDAQGAALLRDARRAAQAAQAAAGGANTRRVTATWTSSLYGQPGHIDPVTGRQAWVMYYGLDAGRTLGLEASVINRLMMGIIGPHAKIRPWRVPAGHRGGTADCAVAWLARAPVAVCGWTSGHMIGVVASPTRDTTVAELATLMAKMRLDLQHP